MVDERVVVLHHVSVENLNDTYPLSENVPDGWSTCREFSGLRPAAIRQYVVIGPRRELWMLRGVACAVVAK
jgi:hypothetical protein